MSICQGLSKKESFRQTNMWCPTFFVISKQGEFKSHDPVTNRYFLKAHQAKVDKSIDIVCRFCMEDDETSLHLMGLCISMEKTASSGSPILRTTLGRVSKAAITLRVKCCVRPLYLRRTIVLTLVWACSNFCE